MTKEQIIAKIDDVLDEHGMANTSQLIERGLDTLVALLPIIYEAGFKEGYKRNGYIDVEPTTVETE